MTAKQYLLQYKNALAELKCKEAERQALLDKATNISPALVGGAPTAGNITDKTGRGGTNIAEIDKQIEAEQAKLAKLLANIRHTIAQVPDTAERNLLTYYYICDYTWEQTAVEMNYSYNHVVANLHPSALRKVAIILKRTGQNEVNNTI